MKRYTDETSALKVTLKDRTINLQAKMIIKRQAMQLRNGRVPLKIKRLPQLYLTLYQAKSKIPKAPQNEQLLKNSLAVTIVLSRKRRGKEEVRLLIVVSFYLRRDLERDRSKKNQQARLVHPHQNSLMKDRGRPSLSGLPRVEPIRLRLLKLTLGQNRYKLLKTSQRNNLLKLIKTLKMVVKKLLMQVLMELLQVIVRLKSLRKLRKKI